MRSPRYTLEEKGTVSNDIYSKKGNLMTDAIFLYKDVCTCAEQGIEE